MIKPKISIVTAVFNGERYLQRLIDSIRTQSYKNFEFIIIDGGSRDKTVEIIRKNSDLIAYTISEKDKGIYDAWNKGVQKTTGDWIMFLGADDILLDKSLEYYAEFLATNSNGELDYISSQVEMIDNNGKPFRIKGGQWQWPTFLNEMLVAHPGSLHSKDYFKKYGLFNTEYKIVGDYELLLRAKESLRAKFFKKVTIRMQEGGASDSIKAIKEQIRASIQTGGNSISFAYFNGLIVAGKFMARNFFKKLGVHVYLKR